MPKVYDCFTFFNELDLLEVRLNELDGVVDRFVLCESPYTFRGKPKPLFFHENRDRFAQFLPKIEHVVVDDMPLGGPGTERSFFQKERFQRNALKRGLASAADDDFVILCDLDEIPRASAIESIVHGSGPRSVYTLQMRHYVFFLNLRWDEVWNKPRMARYGDIRNMQALRSGGPGWVPKQKNPLPVLRQWKRMIFGVRPRPWVQVPEAGWHLTTMNGPAAIHEKITAFSHVLPHLEDEKAIAARLAHVLGKAFSETERSSWIIDPIDQLPPYVVANAERFAPLMATPETLTLYRGMAPAESGLSVMPPLTQPLV